MRKILINFILFSSLVAKTDYIPTSYKYQDSLKIGINVNWAVFSKLIRSYNSSYIKPFVNKGFNTVRVRFDFRKKVLKNFHYNKAKYIKFLKKIVKDCEKYNLNIVLANGANDFKQHPNETTLKELLNNWILIAKSFKKNSYKISYNLIIEPGKKLNQNSKLLNRFYKIAYRSIRKIDKQRILIWAPNHRSNPLYLSQTWYPYKDNYVIAEWHMFAGGPKKNYEREIQRKIKFAYNWSLEHNIPTWVGAWMPGNYNKGDTYSLKEQIEFSNFMLDNLREKNIPSTINADTQYFNYIRKEWNEREIIIDYIINSF